MNPPTEDRDQAATIVRQEAAATAPPPEIRQRWRITYARPAPSAPSDVGRDYAASWEAALGRSALPLAAVEAGRPKLAFGAPLPTGIVGRAELLEIWLTDRLPAWRVREGLLPNLPEDHRLQDLENVWLGAPALPGRINGAVYAITLAEGDAGRLATAVDRLVEARRLERERQKGGTTKTYDLRALIAGLELMPDIDPPTLRLRTRIHPELGSGRPDEVLAVLAETLGAPLAVTAIVRERLILSGE